MAKIFISGSADGLGYLAARELIALGHDVVAHARNEKRAKEASDRLPGVKAVLTADLSMIAETKQLAAKMNNWGRFDAIIHNAGVYTASAAELFQVNSLAPYVLTCMIEKPRRLIYLSSDMHKGGQARLDTIKNNISHLTYSDTKLQVLMLSKAVARHWPHVFSNAVNPGWVPTKMGGKGAPDDLKKGYETQVWLAVSNDEKAQVSGRYFFHKKEHPCHPEADDMASQEKLLSVFAEITGVALPS